MYRVDAMRTVGLSKQDSSARHPSTHQESFAQLYGNFGPISEDTQRVVGIDARGGSKKPRANSLGRRVKPFWIHGINKSTRGIPGVAWL